MSLTTHNTFAAALAPRRVAVIGADTPVGVALLDILGRSPLIERIAVVKCSKRQWSTHHPEFWPRSAAPLQVDTRDVASLTAALQGIDTLFWTFSGHSVRDAHTLTRAVKAAGVSHLSVVTSTAWGTSHSDGVKKVENQLRASGVPRVSIFRPKILLLPEGAKGPRGREMELEAQGGLRQVTLPPGRLSTPSRHGGRRMLSEGLDSDELHWFESSWFASVVNAGLGPAHHLVGNLVHALSVAQMIPPRFRSTPRPLCSLLTGVTTPPSQVASFPLGSGGPHDVDPGMLEARPPHRGLR